MVPSPPSSGLRNMRDFFTRADKEKIPSELRHSLSLLQLPGLDGLEERFLATDAFLRAWAVFRDSVFLLQPDAMPRPTAIATNETESGISRMDVLWFYTQFDEGERRHDPRANEHSGQYTTMNDLSLVDKSGWGTEAYEKHLFAWLLQAFKVGKARNPWGFDYFELRNVCTVWEAVIVPIINGVRASYSVKGRRHYGRLALFIEERCPSGLAFPKGNVSVPEGCLSSPTPYRVVTVAKKTMGDTTTGVHSRTASVGVLTRKHYDEAEKELRNVYPQYGGLVERPKFKHKMEEWLAEQRARADRRKAAETADEVDSVQPQVVKRDSSRSPVKKDTSGTYSKQLDSKEGSPSPIKRYSDSIRRSVSRGMSKMALKEEPKSPLHGVTRQIQVPDDVPPPRPARPQDLGSSDEHDSFNSLDSSDTTIVTPWPRPDTQRKPSEQSVYTSVRNSSPFTRDLAREPQAPRPHAHTDDSVFSPMGQLSAIPKPLHKGIGHFVGSEETDSVHQQKSYADVRIPSYEGTGWEDEISPTKLQTVQKSNVRTPEPNGPKKPPTRLPVPIKPAPYAGNLRVASRDNYRDATPKPLGLPNAAPAKPMAWLGTTPPISTTWPGVEDQDALVPPLPSKSPERWNSNRGHVSGSRPQQLFRNDSRSMARIVSKENIRSALGGNSRESSAEDLTLPPPLPVLYGPHRTMSPRGTRLQTYNTNLFPRRDERKGTPVGGWVGADRRRYDAGGPYEMKVLGRGKNIQGAQKTAAANDGGRKDTSKEGDNDRSRGNWI